MNTTSETDIREENAAGAIAEPSRSGATAEPCPFVWYELYTPDSTAAAAFYEPVLGWKLKDAGMPNKKYTLLHVGETPVGGLLERPATGCVPGESARWMAYIGVPDARLYSRLVWEAEGKVHRAAEEIPGVGTFAVVADPQGAPFVLFQPPAGMARPEQPAPCTPGMPVWHDLGAPDAEAAFRFYSDLFGWTKAQAMDMGPNGVYQIFSIGSQPAGGMMTVRDPGQGSGWLFYFHVDGIEAAIERVKQHGGRIVHGPSPIAGGEQMAHCVDTQGGIFGIVGPSRS